MIQLPSQADLRRDFSYDSETGIFARQKDGYEGYINNIGYRQISYAGRIYGVHRLIWKWVTGEDPPMLDHCNRLRSDNRWSNLRLSSWAENNRNRGLSSKNKSTGVKGISYVPYGSSPRQRSIFKYRAMIKRGTKVVFIRYCDTLEEAKTALTEARERLHGDYACDG